MPFSCIVDCVHGTLIRICGHSLYPDSTKLERAIYWNHIVRLSVRGHNFIITFTFVIILQSRPTLVGMYLGTKSLDIRESRVTWYRKQNFLKTYQNIILLSETFCRSLLGSRYNLRTCLYFCPRNHIVCYNCILVGCVWASHHTLCPSPYSRPKRIPCLYPSLKNTPFLRILDEKNTSFPTEIADFEVQ